MTGVFLQARLESSRFPNKALETICGYTLLEHCMAALAHVDADIRVLLTDNASANSFAASAEAFGFDVFVGSKHDVLHRFARAAERYGISQIVRATGDNPLVSADLANRLFREHSTVGSDYSGYIGMPLGTGVEVIHTQALLRADAEATDEYDREHVAPYIYRHPKPFRTHRPTVEPALQNDSRVTVDTPEDLENVRRIFEHLYFGRPIEIHELVGELRATIAQQNPQKQSA